MYHTHHSVGTLTFNVVSNKVDTFVQVLVPSYNEYYCTDYWCPRTTSTTVPIIAAEKSELHPSPFRRNTPNSIAYNGHSYISRRRSLTGHFQENNGALEQRVIQYRCTTVQLILQRNQNFLCHRCSSILAKMQYIVLDAR